MKPRQSRKQQNTVGVAHRREAPPASLGTDPERRLHWLVGFAQETEAPDTAVAIRTVHHQLGAYLGGLRIRCAGTDHGGPHVMEVGDPLLADELPMTGEDNQKPLDDKLALIRTGLRRVLKECLALPTDLMPLTAEVAVQRSLDGKQVREQLIAADVREGIKFRLLEDLAQAGALLRQCPATGCTKIFVRRFRQEFCTTACRNRTNFRKWYRSTRIETAATFGTRAAPRAKRRPPAIRARLRGKQSRRAKTA